VTGPFEDVGIDTTVPLLVALVCVAEHRRRPLGLGARLVLQDGREVHPRRPQG
jgi:hypothetical protein